MSFTDFQKRHAQATAKQAGGEAGISRPDPLGPAVYTRRPGDADAGGWLAENQEAVRCILTRDGALLLRGFDVSTPHRLEQAVVALDSAPMPYRENTSPRTVLTGEIKTSTDHPADQAIEMHCEQSYSRLFPLHLFLACDRPADVGGETPVADTRRILDALPKDIRDTLGMRGYIYRRIFYPGLGPDWRETYLVDGKTALERHLLKAGIAWRWLEGGILQTDILRRSIAVHPLSGDRAWFSHLLFWHHSSLEPALASELLDQFGPYALPNGVLHSDGSLVSDAEIATIREAYRKATHDHVWQRGDLLVLDNVLTAHGRNRFEGPRRIMFAMARPVDAADENVNWIAG